MNRESPENPRTIAKNRSRKLAFGLGIPLLLLALFLVEVIPPVIGRVEDAITGRSIRDIRLTLQTSGYEGWSVNTKISDHATTGRFGWFILFGALRWRGLPLSDIRSSWLTVNLGDEASGQEETSAETQVLYNPMSNRRGWPAGNKKYFPMTVTFRRDGCDRAWAATCLYRPFFWGGSLPLIPVVEHLEDCKKIWGSALQENCRQLNTYRAAFLHVDSYEEVKKGKELCNAVDQGTLSKACLDQLALYVANPAYDRPIKPQVNEPIPDGLFPDTLGGLPALKKHCGPRLEFSGRVMCGAAYGSDNQMLVTVSVEEWPELPVTSESPLWNPQYTDHADATVFTEEHAGGKVLRYHGPKFNSYFWYSGDRHVEVFFYQPIPQQEEFVTYYLNKLPSNFH